MSKDESKAIQPASPLGYDIGSLLTNQANSYIIQALLTKLFDPQFKFDFKSITVLVRSFILAFAAKVLLEESKSVTDKFKFSDVNRLKYIWQFCCYRHTSYEFHFINNKWTYTDRIISFDLLNTFWRRDPFISVVLRQKQ